MKIEKRKEESCLAKSMESYRINNIGAKEERFFRYMEVIREKRRWGGLVSRSCAERPEKEIAESLCVLSVLNREERMGVVDIGSGGGLLGITLAVVCPEWRITMIESSGRKCAFIAETIGVMGLGNAEVRKGRAEEIVGEGKFDVAVSRAAGRLAEVVPLAIGLLRAGGLYVALKGGDVEEEVKQSLPVIESHGGRVVEIKHPDHPCGLDFKERISLVVIEKV